MTRVVIAGSGVAALEAVLALRALAGRGFEIDLLAPEHALVDRPTSVRTPFGLGAAPSLDLHGLASRYDVRLVQGELAGVDPDARLAWVEGGDALLYDHLLVAIGARPAPAVPGALTFGGPADARAVQWVLEEAVRGHRERIAVAVPSDVTWPLPAYELAIMARTELDMQGGRDVAVTVVTAEPEPLAIFGDEAGAALRELLAQRRIRLRTGARPEHITGDVLWLESGEAVLADTVLSLPRFEGPRLPGLPCDDHGFIPTDADGSVQRPRARGRRRHELPGQAGRPGRPAGRRRGGDDRPAPRRPRGVASLHHARPARRPAHRWGSALPASGARCLRRAGANPAAAAAEQRLHARVVVAAGQDRRPLPRPVHGHRAAGRYRPTSRWWISKRRPSEPRRASRGCRRARRCRARRPPHGRSGARP